MRRFMIVCAALTTAMATYGLDMLTGDTTCERVLRSDRWFLIYRQTGTLTVNTSGTVDILLVGGGGGGGQNSSSQVQQGGGGGGGGGVLYTNSYVVTPGTYIVTIGAGGAIGQNGGNTTAFGLTAYGGGGGANYGGHAGNDGATGGGATFYVTPPSGVTVMLGGSAIHGDADNHGYAGSDATHQYGAGGGGGAGQEAYSNATIRVGSGGDGYPCDILGTTFYYGGGGAGYRGGSSYKTTGGKGGGGSNTGSDPEAGKDGLGGGGSGGARGGSGVVIIAFTPSVALDVDSADFLLTGGDEILPIWDETVHIFRQSGTLTVTGSGSVELLAVGGGGGGGSLAETQFGCGGGGAGGFVHLTDVPVIAGTYAITVGAGGGIGTNGEDTVALGVRAFGGGAGAKATVQSGNGGKGEDGHDGASGGGGTSNGSDTHSGGAAIYSAYGNLGNNGGTSDHVFGAAGGGGASAPGASNNGVSAPGAGGDGTNCCITGRDVWYAGGGAGYRENSNTSPTYMAIPGGKGGGGGFGKPGVDGTGGGGSGNQPGGSGFVAIRYRKKVYVDEFKDATGGVKTHIPGYDIHTFTNNGTFTMPCAGKVEVLLVGGGGGGGRNGDQRDLQGGGGGGAGGVMITNLTLAAGNHSITIGEGGAVGANGGDTIAFNLTAYGGGAGARFRSNMSEQNPPGYIGNSGASGGGSTYYYYYTNLIEGGYSPALIDGTHVPGGSAIYAAEGNLGHDGGWSEHPYGAGGGGGAGAVGSGTTGSGHSSPGPGGDGVVSGITGTAKYYGGGGAGFRNKQQMEGGLGGGGECKRIDSSTSTPMPGTDGLGGGGCGGAKGGSGVVIVRYKLPPKGIVVSFR